MKIGVIIAMEKEVELFAKNLQNFSKSVIAGKTFLRGNFANKEIITVIAGIGKVNSAICATYLITNFNVDLIVNIGISGGLDSSLQIGNFIIGTDMVYHDVFCGEPDKYGQISNLPLYYHSDPELTAKLPGYKHGLLCCGDKFIIKPEELLPIKEKFPSALAVDMESAAIAQTCYLHHIPFLCVRQISDTPGIKHHAEQYDEFWRNAPQNSFAMFQKIIEIL
jgi:adenosylhomocysteine nucleosidase